MINSCPHCADVRESLARDITDSHFGKLTKQCHVCKALWAISKTLPEPVIIETDTRVQPPKGNRLAFVNDPRRRRPQ